MDKTGSYPNTIQSGTGGAVARQRFDAGKVDSKPEVPRAVDMLDHQIDAAESQLELLASRLQSVLVSAPAGEQGGSETLFSAQLPRGLEVRAMRLHIMNLRLGHLLRALQL